MSKKIKKTITKKYDKEWCGDTFPLGLGKNFVFPIN